MAPSNLRSSNLRGGKLRVLRQDIGYEKDGGGAERYGDLIFNLWFHD